MRNKVQCKDARMSKYGSKKQEALRMDHLHLPEQTLFTHRLTNGLQIVGQSMPDTESVALAYSMHTGARDEDDPSLEGISHFLEHMLFKGTEELDRRQLDQEFTRIGAKRNGATATEYTMYYAQVLPEYLERAMELLNAMMYPRLLEHEFEAEKQVILNEIARSEDQPERFTRRNMMRAYFGALPLGNNVLGTRESIGQMQVAHMSGYWRSRYITPHIVLSVAGKLNWEAFLCLAERLEYPWHPGQSGQGEREVFRYEPAGASQHIMVNPQRKQQILMLTMPMVAGESDDYEAAMLGASVLGRSKGSRLYWRIVQKGLAATASASVQAMEGTGILLLQANVAPPKARQVLQLLREELDHLQAEGPTKDELERAKALWINNLIVHAEYPYSRMRALAFEWVKEKRLIPLSEWIGRIQQVTTDDVLRVFQRFPLCEKQVLTAYGPLNEQALLKKSKR
jgi:predicted Zn-dependent peptidase